MNNRTWTDGPTMLIGLSAYLAGIYLAKGFWATGLALIPFFAWYNTTTYLLVKYGVLQ